MDTNQEQMLLQAIAMSSSSSFGVISMQDRETAFRILEDFKMYDGRLPVCIAWLQQERLVVRNQQPNGSNNQEGLEITVPTKLFALEIINGVMEKSYAKLNDNERLALRQAVLQAARQSAPLPVTDEARIMGKKLALLLAGLAVRDFPQRWPNFIQDMFSPGSQGGLWTSDVSTMHQHMGVKIGLECLKIITEDCTDSDFNSKISTTRRNDVLIGLNEVSSQFLPQLFHVLEQFSLLTQAKTTLHNMRTFLVSNQRDLTQMTPDEASLYQSEVLQLQHIGRLIADCLVTLERFCQSMPLDWMWSYEFIPAFLHLLREPTSQIQVNAVACLEALSLRGKLELNQWLQLITRLPPAVAEANQQMQVEQEHQKIHDMVTAGNGFNINTSNDPLSIQLEFHRSLSRMLSHMVSSHLAHISTDRELLDGRGLAFDRLSAFLRLMVDILHHPSGVMAGEQINTWIGLMRDPHIAKSRLLQPVCEEILSRYMDHMVRIRWEDVENQVHPFSAVMEASWDDEDEYDTWSADLRSKASQLFKLIGNTEPQIGARVLNVRAQFLVTTHGNGEPFDHLDPTNNQLTQKSDAVLNFEGFCQPLEYVTAGLPAWSVVANKIQKDDKNAQARLEICANTSAALSQLAKAIVEWNPNYVWLKFRRAQLLESLKYYWKHDPSTLLQGVDSLLRYLSAPDDWSAPGASSDDSGYISSEVVSLRKKSAVALISVSKHVPQHLVPWLAQLSEATRNLFSSTSLLPATRMHIYEFLSCVATAVDDPVARSNFISDVLSDAVNTIESPEVRESISSVENFLSALGIADAARFPSRVTDPANVKKLSDDFSRLFSAFNQLVSVGKRCHEASRKRPNGGIPLLDVSNINSMAEAQQQTHFPDEGPVSIRDLACNDPFVPLWLRVLPALLQVLDVTLRVWRPENQAVLLRDPLQRFTLAISDDDAYLTKKTDSKSGGVFGEGGTAGSIVSGADRRDANLVPRWSGWLNELRNTCFQLLGLLAGERALYAPEISSIFPRLADVLGNQDNLRAMEHRHLTQYLKQFIEILMLSCPATMYATHMEPLLRPVLEHLLYRLDRSWRPILSPSALPSDGSKALTSTTCTAAATVAERGGEEWFSNYYARSGLFVGDLDMVTAEAAVEKYRVELTRTVSDVIQSVLALKGDWALVLANIAKEDQATRNNDVSKLLTGPKTRLNDGGPINADGTPRTPNQLAIDARKILRISSVCHFLLLESGSIAGNLTLLVIQCLEYPDAYTCRRLTRICHRILETVAWAPQYTELLGNRMFVNAIKNIVTEPKWMVGIEWDMINLVRDIYCRLWLGQMLQPGGQGPGLQQTTTPGNDLQYEQAKTVDRPLQGGGILTVPSQIPRQILARLPGVGLQGVEKLDEDMRKKRSAKDQKDFLRDLLRVVADNLHESEVGQNGRGAAAGLFERAVHEESLLHTAKRTSVIPDIPEKLVTQSMVAKQAAKDSAHDNTPEGLAAFHM